MFRWIDGMWMPLFDAPDDGGQGEVTPPVEVPPEPKVFDQGYVEKLRRESAGHRTKANEVQAELEAAREKLQAIEDAEKTEAEQAAERAERAEAERDAAVERANATLMRAAVVNEAAKQQAIDPDAVLALLAGDAVTIADNGEVTGAEEAVMALLQSKPYLLSRKPSAGPSGGGVRESPEPASLDQQIRDAESSGDWPRAGALKAQKLAASKS